MIDYHPTDADADMVVKYIVETVDDYIEHLHPNAYPDFISEYIEKHNVSFKDCCSIDVDEMLQDLHEDQYFDMEMLVQPTNQPTKNENITFNDYLYNLSKTIFNHIQCAGFINYWLNDLKEYDKLSLERLAIKINIRLLNVIKVYGTYIRDELISRVFYHLRDKAAQEFEN